MLRIRIKTMEKSSEECKNTLKQFFIEYSNAFFYDLNHVLSDYHSIQEHASRNKIIEFSSRKLKDLHLLQIFTKGAFLQKSLQLRRFLGEDCFSSSMKIVEMVDFLAGLFENMKTSFIPQANFALSLQTFIDYKKLLPFDQYRKDFDKHTSSISKNISESDFGTIHRMMKIYLLKEEISNFTIENGILFIRSGFFTFKLALCGDFSDPVWQLYNVQSHMKNRLIEDQILKRINTISLISKFNKFYENKRNAVSIFNIIDEKTGFYQNFSGSIGNAELTGYFKDLNFYCKLKCKDFDIELKNPTVDQIKELLNTEEQDNKNIDDDIFHHKSSILEFRKEIFGPNETYYRSNLFFCLSKAENICFVGEALPMCGLKFIKMRLFKTSHGLIALSESVENINQANELIEKSQAHLEMIDNALFLNLDPISNKLFLEFIDENEIFLNIAYSKKDLDMRFLIHKSICTDIIIINANLDIIVISKDANRKLITTKSVFKNDLQVFKEYASKMIDLLQIQFKTPLGYGIVKNKIGDEIVLVIDKINIKITDRIETNIQTLSHDCLLFGIVKGLKYIMDFGVFYKFKLFPTFYTEKRIIFRFEHFTEENVEITTEDGIFSIKGPKTLEITKISNKFTSSDAKTFVILHKFFLADRFIFLKKILHKQDSSTDPNEICLDGNRKILLTQDGIKFKSDNYTIDQEFTDSLNLERDIERYVYDRIIK